MTRRPAALLVAALLLLAAPASGGELAKQWQHPRVKVAEQEKGAAGRELFKAKALPFPPRGIFLRIFKEDAQLELWARKASDGPLTLVKSYPICAGSGTLGPKRQEGDLQVPEGFYVVSQFNPNSNFYLSLGVSYPNESDRILGVKGSLGGAIMIHGNCVTIGCMPLTDDGIKELYVVALSAREAGQQTIPIHIFPTRLDEKGMKHLETLVGEDAARIAFWRNLKPGYDAFEKTRRVPKISVGKDGAYRVTEVK